MNNTPANPSNPSSDEEPERYSSVLRTNRPTEEEVWQLGNSVTELLAPLRRTLYLAGLPAQQVNNLTDKFGYASFDTTNPRIAIGHAIELLEPVVVQLADLDREWALEGYDNQ